MSAEDFGQIFDSFRASLPGRIRVSDDTLKRLREELENFDVQRIAESIGGSIAVWFDKDGDGQIRSVELPADDAMEFYKAGFQVYIRGVDSPTLTKWRRSFHEQSGLGDHFTCDLFATRNPHVAACHFDHVENFTLQLVGSKVWRVAPNRSVHLPTADLREIGIYATGSFPEAMPDEYEEYTLEPGHLLYTPRGYWHEVLGASESETLSLLICYPALTWADLIAPALRPLLLRKERWRMSAHCTSSDGSEADVGQSQAMIGEAAAELCTLDPHFLFAQGGFPQKGKIQRNPLSTLSIYPGTNTREVLLIATVHIGLHSRRHEVAVPSEWRDCLEQLLDKDALSVEDVYSVAGPASSAILDVLHNLDVVRTVGVEQ
jgi:50S ribosomal protein L16 3-hydroxylase